MRSLGRWTLPASTGLVIVVLLACKKKEEPPPPAPAPAPVATEAGPPADAATAKSDDVKRYPDKEREERGTVRVIFANAKVYKEADDTTDHISTLSIGTLVNRKAAYGNWMLIDWPSGVGELSPGWILGKQLDSKTLDIDIEKVKNQDASVVIVDSGTTTTKPDASATPDAGTTGTADAATKDGGRLKIPLGLFKDGGK